MESSLRWNSLENPLSEPIFSERRPDPCTIVIFGASGDLTQRKLIPALYDQAAEQHLPSPYTIIGCARTPMSHDSFRERMRTAVSKFARTALDAQVWDGFAASLFYAATENEEEVAQALLDLAGPRGCAHSWLFYMTTPPAATLRILRGLWRNGLAGPGPAEEQPGLRSAQSRVVLEKPFGLGQDEARDLNRAIAELFPEECIFRIDHYLGKEAVQNILIFRFANRIFEPVWNNRDVDHVEITVSETVGVERRASYYETSGAIRDMVQNHLLQLLALVAMEPPSTFSADAVRDEKVKVLRAIRPIRAEEVPGVSVRAQYGRGWLEGRAVPAYREEPGVSPGSNTETYAALRLLIDNWRWAGVPFYLRSGKRLAKRVSEIAVQFRRVPHLLFGNSLTDQVEPNMFVMRIQPNEGISLRFEAKLPGTALRLRSLNMDFNYGTAFGNAPPEAYERLLLDCMLGDSTLFSRRDGVDASWEALMPIVDRWANDRPAVLPLYEAGTWGPVEAEDLLERDGRRWRRL